MSIRKVSMSWLNVFPDTISEAQVSAAADKPAGITAIVLQTKMDTPRDKPVTELS